MGRYFSDDIPPKCEYCAVGRTGADNSVVLCTKCGVMAPEDSCKKFVYDPLRRVPKTAPELERFDEKEFLLDE